MIKTLDKNIIRKTIYNTFKSYEKVTLGYTYSEIPSQEDASGRKHALQTVPRR